MRTLRTYHLHWSEGFTLLEMTLAVGIFSVLVVATIGIMLGVSNAQIKAANIQAIHDNIRFGLELMTKELRTGTSYQLTRRCADTTGQEITFVTAQQQTRVYFLDAASGTILRSQEPLTLSSDCEVVNGKVFPLTAPEVLVERLLFQVHGGNAGPQDGQAWITIALRVSSRATRFGPETNMNLQTTVVQRLRDL